MKPVIVSTLSGLDEPGDCITLEAYLDEESYTVGPDVYALPSGLSYDVVLTNTKDAFLLTGVVRADVRSECARCLEPVEFSLVGEVEGYYLFQEGSDVVDDLAEDEYEYVGEDDTIDISDALLAALVIETPLMPLCDDECKGICPHCGADLNKETCACATRTVEETSADNPFAVLKTIDFTEPPTD